MRGILSGQKSFNQPCLQLTHSSKDPLRILPPFKLMFGRECDPFGLLKLITGTPEDTNIKEDESIDDEQV